MILFRVLVRAALMILHLRNNTLAVGKMWVAGKDDWGVGAQEGGPSWGSAVRVVLGVATLE